LSRHLIIPDSHAHPGFKNDRADLLSRLIADIQPDVVVNMGDQWDFPSLSSYDKGQRSFFGRTYRADVDSGNDFSDRIFSPLKRRKKKLPRFVFLEGNHEHRIERALDLSPELTNTVSFNDLDLRYYSDIVRYNGKTPGQIEIDGIQYAHYFLAGISGRPLSGEHHGYTLISKLLTSATASHTHLLDYAVRKAADDRWIMGLVSGCYLDYDLEWAGETNKLWWRGVIVKDNVENGQYNPRFISLKALEKEYGKGI